MRFLNKTISFLAVFSVLPSAFALTARPSVITTPASRGSMPTMTRYLTTSSGTTNSANDSSALLVDTECVDAYTECIKGSDACGSDFEECTNTVLFHAKMPQCLSTLMQCNVAGISNLFGTPGTGTTVDASIKLIGNVRDSDKNKYGEIENYQYPTAGSVLGQMIAGGAISNKYDTSTCIRRYTSCIKKDDVCGEDFELCTSNTEFKKQRVLCDSTLARCPGEAKVELFGGTATSDLNAPKSNSRIGEMIKEGGALAAVNAVSTCYKVADQCILSACSKNPYKCYDKSTLNLIDLAENILDPENSISKEDVSSLTGALDEFGKKNVNAYIKAACYDTISTNKYCYATAHEGNMPTASKLQDPDEQDITYQDISSTRMNASMQSKIADLITKFDTKTKQACADTIKSCAMRTCGSGNGAVCYGRVFGETKEGLLKQNNNASINGEQTYTEIKNGCEAIVNTDFNCKYAAANTTSAGMYSYDYIDNGAFDTLFPAYDASSKSDPIGAVATLNAALQSAYSDAAITQMRKQCEAVASNCIKTECGANYEGCYRNRSDAMLSTYRSGDATYDASFNKVNGVLDYTIIIGLCLNTIKDAPECETSLKMEEYRIADKNVETNKYWNDGANTYGSVRSAWYDAAANVKAPGATTSDDDSSSVSNRAAESLFQQVIADAERTAQSAYSAKLTREHNQCAALNKGGIRGADSESAFQWVKLKNGGSFNSKTYTTEGLKSDQFSPTDDLFGAFCRVQVKLQSSDPIVNEVLNKKDNVYFAAGDTFSCGSWLTESDLKQITDKIAQNKSGTAEERQKKANKQAALWGIGGMLVTGVGGYLGGEAIRGTNGKGVFSNLGTKKNNSKSDILSRCKSYADSYAENVKTQSGNASSETAKRYKAALEEAAKTAGVAEAYINTFSAAAAAAEGDSSKENAAATAAATLKTECEYAVKNGKSSDSESKSNWDKWGAPLTSTLVSSAAGYGLTFVTAREIIKNNLDQEAQNAVNEWMAEVGDHISCYIGGNAAGSYGDMVTITLD